MARGRGREPGGKEEGSEGGRKEEEEARVGESRTRERGYRNGESRWRKRGIGRGGEEKDEGEGRETTGEYSRKGGR